MSKRGMDAKLYIGNQVIETDPEDTGLSWSEVEQARDVNLNLAAGEADVTSRGNSGWRATRATLKEGTIEFEMIYDPGDTEHDAIRDAYLNGTALAMAVMDGPIATVGSEGFAANCRITNFSRSEPLEEGITISVTAKPEDLHQWYEKTT